MLNNWTDLIIKSECSSWRAFYKIQMFLFAVEQVSNLFLHIWRELRIDHKEMKIEKMTNLHLKFQVRQTEKQTKLPRVCVLYGSVSSLSMYSFGEIFN